MVLCLNFCVKSFFFFRFICPQARQWWGFGLVASVVGAAAGRSSTRSDGPPHCCVRRCAENIRPGQISQEKVLEMAREHWQLILNFSFCSMLLFILVFGLSTICLVGSFLSRCIFSGQNQILQISLGRENHVISTFRRPQFWHKKQHSLKPSCHQLFEGGLKPVTPSKQ